MASTCEIHDYKHVGGRPIQLDLWRAKSLKDGPRPAIVYFHGGKLVGGNRRSLVPSSFYTLAYSQNYLFISADYRLLVPATGHEILSDVLDLFNYLAERLGECVDLEKIAVIGHSAGGYPARLAALYVKPKITAMVLMYGRGGDLFCSQYMSPPPGITPELDAEAGPYLRPTLHQQPHPREEWDIEEKPPGTSTPLSVAIPIRTSRLLWTAILAEGSALDWITGAPGVGEGLRETTPVDLTIIPKAARRVIPQLCMDDLELMSGFPSTYLVHGRVDKDVLIEESTKTYVQLRDVGVRAEIIVLENEGHFFEYGREYETGVKEVMDGISAFLIQELGP